MDLIQEDSSRSESSRQDARKNESIVQSNKPLRFIVNSDLTDRSEEKIRTNDPLPNVVNQRLSRKSESISAKEDQVFNISATSGAGFDVLLAELTQYAGSVLAGAESALVTRARHRHALEETLAVLRRALGETSGHEDLLAEELRLAASALGRLTGRVDVEDILDVIFRDFCIGK
jgi:tRNA modification GTPase